MKKISVIVPLYNGEDYIARTVEALVGQSHQNLEIVLVDDGSTDASGEICRALAREHGNILFYRTPEGTPNGGPGNARNLGLSLATGEYIAFCDSDDLPESDMYATLCTYLEQADADVALCDIYSQRDGRRFGLPWEDGTVLEQKAVREELIVSMVGNPTDDDTRVPLWGSVCRGLYKKELIQEHDISFPTEYHFAEDLVFSLRYLARCRRAVICDKALYFYTCNENSIMNSHRNYQENMLSHRLCLVKDVLSAIQDLPNAGELERRFLVTQRCYYHECVGNACRRKKGAVKKLREIVNHSRVRAAFENFDATGKRKKLIYTQIQKRRVLLLRLYYFLRFWLH